MLVEDARQYWYSHNSNFVNGLKVPPVDLGTRLVAVVDFTPPVVLEDEEEVLVSVLLSSEVVFDVFPV